MYKKGVDNSLKHSGKIKKYESNNNNKTTRRQSRD